MKPMDRTFGKLSKAMIFRYVDAAKPKSKVLVDIVIICLKQLTIQLHLTIAKKFTNLKMHVA